MKKVLLYVVLPLALLLSYLFFWPIGVEPVAFTPPPLQNQANFKLNDRLRGMKAVPLGGHIGPEDIALDAKGLVYAAVLDGEIIRTTPDGGNRESYAKIGGRPLGLVFDAAGDLIVADAFNGLFKITADKKKHLLTNRAGGKAICYANNVDVAPDGVIYFTDSSTRFCAKTLGSTYQASLLDILEHSGTGRFLAYDPKTKVTRVLMTGLQFANGVALAADGTYALIAETGGFQIHRYWLKGKLSGKHEVILGGLPGFPDNVTRGLDGRFWVGFTKPRSKLLDKLAGKPFLRKIILRLPRALLPIPPNYGHIMAINGNGKVLLSLQDSQPKFPDVTGATESSQGIYIHSLHAKAYGYMTREQFLSKGK